MAEKRRRDAVKNEDPNSYEDEDDNFKGADETAIPDPNYTVGEEVSDQEFEEFELKSIEVQAADVLTIREISDRPRVEHNTVENSADEILNDFPSELAEGNFNQLSHTLFDNRDNFRFEVQAEVHNIDDARSFSWIDEKQKNKILRTRKNKGDIVSESDWEGNQAKLTKHSAKSKEGLKGERDSCPIEIRNHRCQGINIYEFDCSYEDSVSNDAKFKFKLPEHSSDEFADFEDSSASDSLEVLFERKTEQAASVKSMKSNRGYNVAHKSGSKSKLIPVTSSSSFEDDIPVNKLNRRNSRSTYKKNLESTDSFFSQGPAKRSKSTPDNNSVEDKNKPTGEMSAIPEPDDEISPITSSTKNLEFPKSDFQQGSSTEVKTATPAKKAAGPKSKSRGEMSTILEMPEENRASSSSAPVSSNSGPNPLKMKTNVGYRKDKCNVCNTKLGLCPIKCRCGGYYCANHRYDKEHGCTYDYKSMGAEEIRKNNPKVVAEKVRKL